MIKRVFYVFVFIVAFSVFGQNYEQHRVEKGETITQVAQKYNVTPYAIYQLNPDAQGGLKPNSILLIPKKATVISKTQKVELKETTKSNDIKKATINYVSYEVKPKETLYSLSKLAGLSQEELIKLNPALANSVEIGMILKVPSTALINQETKKAVTALSLKSSSSERKKLVLLLPFNIADIEKDTINSSSMRLRKDKFLNMTLDFYAGALIAIDSAKSIGIPVDVSIFDSQETKNSSNIATIIQQNNLETTDAVIGPFYQNNVEKTAELFSKKGVPVISPLSKDIGNSYPNLYKSIPTNEVLRTAMFDYMEAKGGNIIAVVDKKKESVRQYIQTNQKGVQFAALQENGSLSVESLKSLFVKNRTNYVVLGTSNTGLIKWTMNTMMTAMANFRVQLVILEPNETLDTDEINFEHLTKLKLTYPSITRENKSPEALVFEKQFRKENKIYPNSYATRGFDLTFDTMMRLSKGNSFQETAATMGTEQVDNKFEYYKKEEGGYTNKGVYILYYDTDLTIKEAN